MSKAEATEAPIIWLGFANMTFWLPVRRFMGPRWRFIRTPGL